MAGRKKTFPCGHTGKGKYCHRCAQEEKRKQAILGAKSEWKDRLSSAPVELDHLPKEVAEKALAVIAELQEGRPYPDLKGKRMITMGQREIISIPVGRRYRLICCDKKSSLECIEVISHEDYNNRLTSGGWSAD